jgi:integrase
MHHLMLIANQLYALGYHKMQARSLKPKHVEALVKDWLRQDLAIGTIKNRMAILRWWAEKVNKQNVVARSNDFYGIPDRQFVTNDSKAREVTAQQLDRITDPHVRMSLELQQAFGLRREEAIKFSPDFADREDHIVLKSTWTKGGKERTVPVRSDEQHAVLDRAHRLAGKLPDASQKPLHQRGVVKSLEFLHAALLPCSRFAVRGQYSGKGRGKYRETRTPRDA